MRQAFVTVDCMFKPRNILHTLTVRNNSVQLPTSADNVTLLAFAAVRRAAATSIDISCPPGPQQQTRRTLVQRSIDGTDRRTDGRTLYRHADPAAHRASRVDKTKTLPCQNKPATEGVPVCKKCAQSFSSHP